MSNWYWRHDYLALPEDLIAFAWSAPMRDLAAKFGVSDVALRKMLRKYGVTLPPQGHWNRVHAGRTVPAPPKPPARRPGENGRMSIDPKFKPFIPKAAHIPSSGPFASAKVPEDLDELRERETKLLGKVAVPKDLSSYHPAFAAIMRSEQRLREKAAESRWYAYSDEAGHLFRHEAGHRTDLKPAIIPTRSRPFEGGPCGSSGLIS